MTLAVAPAVNRRRLFFVLISAVVGQSLCGEGRAIRPHYYQLTSGLLEICASIEHSVGPNHLYNFYAGQRL